MRTETLEELRQRLASCEITIRDLEAIGRSWALDCREMRVAEHNATHLRKRIRARVKGLGA